MNSTNSIILTTGKGKGKGKSKRRIPKFRTLINLRFHHDFYNWNNQFLRDGNLSK